MRRPRNTQPSHEEATDLMVPTLIDVARHYAERAYLGAFGELAGGAESAVISCICDMLAETHRIADALGATASQRHHLETCRSVAFDRRLEELRAFAILPWIYG